MWWLERSTDLWYLGSTDQRVLIFSNTNTLIILGDSLISKKVSWCLQANNLLVFQCQGLKSQVIGSHIIEVWTDDTKFC